MGDPGRAAVEIREGPPVSDIGRSDVELVSADSLGIRIRAASVRGLLHRRQGTPRQDAFALGHNTSPDGPGFVVASVCDGVGSRERSQEAADLVSREVVRLAALGAPWAEAFRAANQTLESHVQVAKGPMATTAVTIRVRRVDDLWLGSVAWVGDSSAWHLGPDGRWLQIGGPQPADDADYHSGRVLPLPSADGSCEQRDFELGGGAVFLFSDGVANPLKWSQLVQESLAEWWSEPPDHFTFAAQVDFAMKGHVDDRTAVGLWPEIIAEAAGQGAVRLTREAADADDAAAMSAPAELQMYRDSSLIPAQNIPDVPGGAGSEDDGDYV